MVTVAKSPMMFTSALTRAGQRLVTLHLQSESGTCSKPLLLHEQVKEKLEQAICFPVPNWETGVFYTCLTIVSLWICQEILPGLWVVAIPGVFGIYTLVTISTEPGAAMALRNGWWYLGCVASLTCITLFASCFYGPLDKRNLIGLAYHFDEGAAAPLTIKFNDDLDTLMWTKGGMLWLPKNQVIHYSYTTNGKAVSGTLPPLPKGQWNMSISHLGIAVYKNLSDEL